MEQERSEIEKSGDELPERPVESSRGFNPIWLLFAFFIFIGLIVFVFGYAYTPESDRRQSEGNAMRRLREIGLAQLAYQGLNNEKHYGSFANLQKQNPEFLNHTLTDFVNGYDFVWQLGNAPSYPLGYGSNGFSSFTITAFPDYNPRLSLRTFGISEDQLVRIYNPDNNNEFVSRSDPHVRTWDPIL